MSFVSQNCNPQYDVQGSAALEVLISNQAASGGKGRCSRLFAEVMHVADI